MMTNDEPVAILIIPHQSSSCPGAALGSGTAGGARRRRPLGRGRLSGVLRTRLPADAAAMRHPAAFDEVPLRRGVVAARRGIIVARRRTLVVVTGRRAVSV